MKNGKALAQWGSAVMGGVVCLGWSCRELGGWRWRLGSRQRLPPVVDVLLRTHVRTAGPCWFQVKLPFRSQRDPQPARHAAYEPPSLIAIVLHMAAYASPTLAALADHLLFAAWAHDCVHGATPRSTITGSQLYPPTSLTAWESERWFQGCKHIVYRVPHVHTIRPGVCRT